MVVGTVPTTVPAAFASGLVCYSAEHLDTVVMMVIVMMVMIMVIIMIIMMMMMRMAMMMMVVIMMVRQGEVPGTRSPGQCRCVSPLHRPGHGVREGVRE
jgi:hypothetical protein